MSYVTAIIARSGLCSNSVDKDFGVDLEVRNIGLYGTKRVDLSTFLELQLKASINWKTDATHIIFDLEADAYNKLVFRRENSSTPCALILCCLPKDEATWLSVCEDTLIIRKCCYYYFVNGEETSNKDSKRIRIPRSQLLTPESLNDLKISLLSGVAV